MNPSPSIPSFVPLSRLFQAPAALPGLQEPTLQRIFPAVLGEHADRPGVELNEIRQFRVAGKEYVFVPAVSAIFGLDDLGRRILDLLRPPDHQHAIATEAVQTAATRHAPPSRDHRGARAELQPLCHRCRRQRASRHRRSALSRLSRPRPLLRPRPRCLRCRFRSARWCSTSPTIVISAVAIASPRRATTARPNDDERGDRLAAAWIPAQQFRHA